MRRFFFDTSVFIYALGREHPYREPCLEIIRKGSEGLIHGEASIELMHEFAHVRAGQGITRRRAVADARNVAAASRLYPVDRADLERALDLWCEHDRLDMRDAIFAAQALNRGIDAILSPDRDFDGIEDLQRIDPADKQAIALLGIG